VWGWVLDRGVIGGKIQANWEALGGGGWKKEGGGTRPPKKKKNRKERDDIDKSLAPGRG